VIGFAQKGGKDLFCICLGLRLPKAVITPVRTCWVAVQATQPSCSHPGEHAKPVISYFGKSISGIKNRVDESKVIDG